ncbi:uncharacterized protein A1O5_07107 [Cladophialophora psammophila CBS 110553]|uniref:HNH nuclease domain-containing protein n=1 Tax=Cladophialophora psammophila CBS 110553 TaxID=1182543 RepID=W9XI45_9EURO|nr:uncharacterized protein A1O5_07107 [Cladophialophora psammophila CBS 110553]EXJ70034.1 hypothetical protein A1O5_07107 [Cladophialophora psammophila CBS 110553]
MAPFPLPPIDLRFRTPIRILHPSYTTPTNGLLSFPRVDRVHGRHFYIWPRFGVHYGTALLACQIVAGNAFNTGRLTFDQAGQRLVELLSDNILTEEVYYFMVGGGPNQYPILPIFRDWEFPHGLIPDSWPQLSTTPNTTRCAISNFSFPVEGAHLVPKNEFLYMEPRWFSDNNDSVNIAPLKADLRKCFDAQWFAIVPKVIETTTAHSPRYVTHILQRQAAEVWPTYHDTTVQYLDSAAHPYLFARFAWAILLQVKPFITAGFSRHVIRISTNGEGKTEYKLEHLSGLQLQNYYSGGGPQGATPKRKSKTDTVADEDHFMGPSGEDSDVNMDNDWEDTMDERQQAGKGEKKSDIERIYG